MTKIVVAAHKPYPMPEGDVYLPLQVGAAGKPPMEGFARDDTGDNISGKNAGYCELTGLYWAWKNLECDRLGLVHYRRLFALPPEGIEAALDGADVLLPAKRRYFIETTYSQYAHAHHAADLDAARAAVARLHPGHLAAFDAVMRARSGHRFNMFVMKRPVLDAYCEWLFGILFEMERTLDVSGYSPYDARVFGFVGERLLDVWLLANGVRYAEAKVVHLESQRWPVKISRFLWRKLRGSFKRV